MDMLFEILFAWNLIGCLVYVGIQLEATHDFIPYVLLNPCDIYDIWKVNYFGCGLLTIIFNLLCPVLTIIYWVYKLIYFICTVGRR